MPGTILAIAISPVATPHAAAPNPAPTEPPEIGSNMILWLDANVTIYTDAAGTTPATTTNQRIELWRDRTDYLWDFTTGSQEERPVFLSSFSGVKCVFFGLDPTNEVLPTWLINEDFGPSGEEELSFALLFVPGSAAIYTRKIAHTPPGNQRIEIPDTELLKVQSNISLDATTPLALNDPVIVTGRISTTGYTLRINNVEEDSDSSTPTLLWNGMILGDDDNPANVYLAEFLVWNIPLSDAQLIEAYQYLQNKHSL